MDMSDPYKNKHWLKNQYINKEKNAVEIANESNTTSTTIYNWLDKFNIKRRNRSEVCKILYKDKHNHPKWNGGKIIDKNGYPMILNRKHPHARKNGYVLEHILIMEKKLGRSLKDDEIVHHINMDKSDNRLENLDLLSSSKVHHSITHKSYHDLLPLLLEKKIIRYDRNKKEYILL